MYLETELPCDYVDRVSCGPARSLNVLSSEKIRCHATALVCVRTHADVGAASVAAADCSAVFVTASLELSGAPAAVDSAGVMSK